MKNKISTEKTTLHPRNPHRFRYDFEKLILSFPELKQYIFINEHAVDPSNSEQAKQTIDFANPDAVKALNKAILISDYDIKYWDIPQNYLCPPIPGRADYIHYIADVLAESNLSLIHI
jgi:23S rRNA (adenine1618-N6)-methyltransferase